MMLMADKMGFAQAYTSYGVRFRLRSNEHAVLDAMSTTVPFGTSIAEEETGSAVFALDACQDGGYCFTGPEEEHVGSDLRQLLQHLRTSLMVHVANYAVDRVFVHAGVVAWQGSAVLFPGTSFAGKTTLVAECVKAGATYFSDEYAVLDESGIVHPYSRDLQMRRPGRPEQRSVPVIELDGTAATTSASVKQVLFTQYTAGAAWQPTPVTAGEAVLEMLQHTIPVQRTPTRVLATLAALMTSAKAFRSPRGEAADVVQHVFRSLA